MVIKFTNPWIKILIPFSTILIFGSGITQFVNIKDQTGDDTLAFLIMIFDVIFWCGIISTIYFFITCYLIPRFHELKLSFQTLTNKRNGIIEISESLPEPQNEFKEAKIKALEEQNRILPEILNYAELTFAELLNDNELTVLIDNIKLFAKSQNTKADNGIKRKFEGVTSNDLYHFGNNIRKRLKKNGYEAASFLKDTFVSMLFDVEIETVKSKLANKEGRYTLPLINPDQPLKPHIFPITLVG